MEIYLAVNRQKDPELSFTRRLQDYIRKQGCGVRILRSYQDAYQNYHFEVPREPGVILALGGDGTYLQCVNDLNLSGLTHPVLGVNLGTLGFLTQVEREDVKAAVDAVLAGDYTLQDYPLLSASVENSRVAYCEQAFNDVVIGRQGFARVVKLGVSIDGSFAYATRCDGILVSTAFGSTAYNVSLGGPVVPPGTPVFVVTPIAPHLPGLRPIIVPETARVDIEVLGSKHDTGKVGLLTCDGRSNGIWLEKNDVVTIRKHTSGGKLLQLGPSKRDFYDVFRDKLLTVR